MTVLPAAILKVRGKSVVSVEPECGMSNPVH